ncbi:sigma-E factor negative regulatory protein [Thiohalomonas denitrificans]|uniref:sigma-E factor negative regulatory protein n=1 Tax=Thiohalomonas denitrificans TaxID=415747 RepID=UPI0026EC8A67|nr:sigma-E factor negative regulatory protein [Thiohalomonas denitrificans]
MQESASERISALADGELDKPGVRRALEELRGREQLEAWERYHLISDTLRGHLPSPYPKGMADRVRSQIDQESAFNLRPRPGFRPIGNYWRQATGMAIAASVTAAAILGVQTLNRTPEAGEQKQVAHASAGVQTPPAPLDAGLDDYLIEHSEFSASPGMHGMLPYVRIVSHR